MPWVNNTLNFRLAHNQVVHLETTANLCTICVKFAQICSIFELGGITKKLNDWPTGNSEFCFHSTLNVPLGFTLYIMYAALHCMT